MIAYKYLHPDRVDVLENASIRFTQPSILNDVFETLADWTPMSSEIERLSIEQARKEGITLSDKLLQDKVEMELTKGSIKGRQLADHFFIFLSLSRRRDSLLMWAHYASFHHGFVIGFDSESTFFSDQNKGKDGLRPIVYKEDRFPISDRIATLPSADQELYMEGLLFTKSRDWQYEEELRIISSPNRADKSLTLPDGQLCYLFDLPSDCVREIILGCEMDTLLRQKVTSIAKSQYPQASLYQAQIHRSKYQLTFTLV